MSLRQINLALIAGLLIGYVFLDRGFAYFGVGSIYVGEIVLALTIMITLITGANLQVLWSPAGYTLLAFFLWSMCILIFNTSGTWINALRDSVIWGYGLYAIFVAALVSRPHVVETSLNWYARWMPWFAAWAAPILILQWPLSTVLPRLPGADVNLITLKAGDTSVHLAGALTFLMLGLHRTFPSQSGRWSSFKESLCYSGLLLGVITAGSRNRGGLLSVLLAVVIIMIFRPNNRLIRLGLVAAIVASILVAFDVSIPTGGGREISVNQILENVLSVAGQSGPKNLTETAEWRLEWWTAIARDTIFGEHFWYGNGFGNSLAAQYGFADATGNRSPHNGHLTILARAGVPGFFLWVLFILALYGGLMYSYLAALNNNQTHVAKLSLWLMAYLTAFFTNMSFDVYLEGPQGGIWFWCVAGFAIALIQAQRVNAAARTPVSVRSAAAAPPNPR